MWIRGIAAFANAIGEADLVCQDSNQDGDFKLLGDAVVAFA